MIETYLLLTGDVMEKVVPAKKKGMGVSTSSAYSNYSKGSENSLPK